jgi:putative membrane protein
MTDKTRTYNRWIIALSIIIPIVVGSLFRVKIDLELPVFLPPIYATINGLTVVILVTALVAIKNGKQKLHEGLMKTALIFSASFLVMYVLYHMTSESTPYGGEGTMRSVYFVILISHILLSIAVIPLVLITFVRGLTGRTRAHKRLARWAFPLWVYVALSGVLVYLMIAPYY